MREFLARVFMAWANRVLMQYCAFCHEPLLEGHRCAASILLARELAQQLKEQPIVKDHVIAEVR
jgi:hypothetical protein